MAGFVNTDGSTPVFAFQSSAPCDTCGSYNGTFYLYNNPFTGQSEEDILDPCTWVHHTFYGCVDLHTMDAWELFVRDDGVDGKRWYLRTRNEGDDPRVWESEPIDDADFNPRGPNTFIRASTTVQCNGAPSQLTVSPVLDAIPHRVCSCRCASVPEVWVFSATFQLEFDGVNYVPVIFDFSLEFNPGLSSPFHTVAPDSGVCAWEGPGTARPGDYDPDLVGDFTLARLFIGANSSARGLRESVSVPGPTFLDLRETHDQVRLYVDGASSGIDQTLYGLGANPLDCLGTNTLEKLGLEDIKDGDDVIPPDTIDVAPG